MEMQSVSKLDSLLDENSGFNPEKALDHGEFFLVDRGQTLIVNDRAYYKTNARSMVDYIERFPRQFGLILNGVFYVEEE